MLGQEINDSAILRLYDILALLDPSLEKPMIYYYILGDPECFMIEILSKIENEQAKGKVKHSHTFLQLSSDKMLIILKDYLKKDLEPIKSTEKDKQ